MVYFLEYMQRRLPDRMFRGNGRMSPPKRKKNMAGSRKNRRQQAFELGCNTAPRQNNSRRHTVPDFEPVDLTIKALCQALSVIIVAPRTRNRVN